MNYVSAAIGIFHSVNQFLGSINGDLFKRTFEFVFLLFATYMVLSEYLKTRSRSLYFLAIGFGSLAAQKFFASLFLLPFIFGASTNVKLFTSFYVTEKILEIAALIIISYAFFTDKSENIKKRTGIEIIIGLSMLLLLSSLLIIPIASITKRTILLISLEVMTVGVLLYPALYFFYQRTADKYHSNVAIAFVIYAINPIINIFNIWFFMGSKSHLKVLAHPFPFLAVVLLARVVFLKLVNKASLQQQLNEARAKYSEEKELCEMKDNFVSIVSHELRTPLTSMKLYLSLIRTERLGPITNDQRKALITLESESNRLANLINDMLDMSSLESKKMRIRRRKVNFYELVANTLYTNLAEEKNITVKNLIPTDLEIYVDTEKFKQVLINLYSNAIKYTNESGEIILTAKNLEEGWMFCLCDNGVGISKNDLPHIFDKFYQVEHHMIRKQGGTGLGLAITKNIIELHKGKIEVKSTWGKGSSFVIRMPHKE